MSFYQKYELMKLVHNGEPKTFQARETSSGRVVYLHLLGNVEAPRLTDLLTTLQRRRASFPTAEQSGILDLDPSPDAPYVVTPSMEGLNTLWDWIDNWALMPPPPAVSQPAHSHPVAAPPPPTPPLQPPPQEPPASSGADEFTKMFQAQAAQPAPPAAPAAPAPPSPSVSPGEFTLMFQAQSQQPAAAPVPPVQPAPAGPGEFTRMFLMPKESTPAAPSIPLPPQPPAPTAMPTARPAEPGEFTRMFIGSTQAPPPPPSSSSDSLATREFSAQPAGVPRAPQQAAPPPLPPPLPPPPPPKSGAGEFTNFFDTPYSASSLPVEEAERGAFAPPSVPQSRPFQGPGNFTQRFGGESVPHAAPPPAPSSPLTSDATSSFASYSAPAPGRDSAPIIQGPSEYTRILQGAPSSFSTGSFSASQAPSVAPPSAYMTPTGAPKKSISSVVIVIVTFVAIGLVLAAVYMFMRGK